GPTAGVGRRHVHGPGRRRPAPARRGRWTSAAAPPLRPWRISRLHVERQCSSALSNQKNTLYIGADHRLYARARSRHGSSADSAMTPADIFDVPCTRLRNEIGTSAMEKPASTAAFSISPWKA